MNHRVRHVQEEGPVLVLLDEAHGPLGVPRRQLRLVRVVRDDAVALDQRQLGIGRRILGVPGPHVVRIGQPEVLVEAVVRRQELRMMAEMPLAVAGRRVAERLGVPNASFRVGGPLEHPGDGRLAVTDPDLRARPQYVWQADPLRITARHQRRP